MPTQKVPFAEHNDAELVAECLEGRQDAFGRIIERYQSLICSLAYSATGSLGRSEDLAQETFLVAWQQLPGLREPASLRSWLCGIARNLIGKALRQDGREPLHAAEPLEAAEGATATEPLPPERAIGKEEEAILWRSVERIPKIYREPLVLFYREHRSVEKVAAALDLTEDTVRQRLSRERKLLHEQVLAFVEGALEDTNPGKAFTVGVLAALPLLTASATGATVATAGSVAAKGGATAKTATVATALGAFLTGGVIFLFSLLGFLVFLGICIGYIMGRSIRQSARQLEYATRFWRSLALGFGVFVGLPHLIVFGLRLNDAEHPLLCQSARNWMAKIFVLAPVALTLWLWRWWRESSPTGLRELEPPHSTRKRFLIWLALAMFVPAQLFTVFLYDMAFKASLTTERLSGAAFQEIVREHKDAAFSVTQTPNGSKTLSIRLPKSRQRVSYFAPADDATLALLKENHITYKTVALGRTAEVLGATAGMLVFLSFVLAPAGGVVLLMRPWRHAVYPVQISPGQANKPDQRAINAFRAFAVAIALALLALASLTLVGTRWGTRTISAADLPKVLTDYKFAQYVVCRYGHRPSELHITPRDYGIGSLVAPANAATLALLKERGIPYRTLFQGSDFGYRNPTPLFSSVFIAVLTTCAVVVLWWSGIGAQPWSPAFRNACLRVFILVFGASILLMRNSPATYTSTARVQVARWSTPAFPQDDVALVKSTEVLAQAAMSTEFNRKWGKQSSDMLKLLGWVEAIPAGQAGVIEVTVCVDDAKEAANIANAVAKAYLDYRNQAGPVAQLMDAAVPDYRPVSRFKSPMLVLGAVAGLLLGLLAGAEAAWVQSRRSRRAPQK